jgi:hypothetical protein
MPTQIGKKPAQIRIHSASVDRLVSFPGRRRSIALRFPAARKPSATIRSRRFADMRLSHRGWRENSPRFCDSASRLIPVNNSGSLTKEEYTEVLAFPYPDQVAGTAGANLDIQKYQRSPSREIDYCITGAITIQRVLIALALQYTV